MGSTGVARIDQLFAGSGAAPIGPGDEDHQAVGVVQDLLIGHGFRELPGLLSANRGFFGPRTTEAVRTFRQKINLPDAPEVDQAAFRGMVTSPSLEPIASRGYVALVLDMAFSGMVRLVSLTALFEGAGQFAAINPNTDRAGLSFGLIQWAQKPGRLNELLRAFRGVQPELFVQIFGGGNAALSDGLLAHTAKTRGGTDESGDTTDPTYDLTAESWAHRFGAAGRHCELQKVQIRTARRAFEVSTAQIRAFAPSLRSERALAFMLDVANQHGDGGARRIFQAVNQAGLSESHLLAAVQNESVARVKAQFGAESNEAKSTRNRREAFRTSAILSDEPVNA
jgi:peptidoglycan hydrolase-like protein with peptidoglycan-binding domain